MAKKILIVDDEANIIQVLGKRLETQGYQVITAVDGLAGLTAAREQNPDLIVLDVMMPKLDGFKVCRMLKFDERYQHIPIIMLSARNQDHDREEGKEQKADAYLTKPYNWDALFNTINDLLNKPSN